MERSPESRQRAEAYWFLASLFADPPGPEQLARMAALGDQGEGENAGSAGEILVTLSADSDTAALAQRLAVEHTRLFGGLREGYGPPPPYESLWREGQLMGDTTVAVLETYVASGFRPDGRWGPPDHLVEELRFMASLANGEGEAWGAARPDDAQWARQRQADFLAGHLLTWLPDYCRTLEHHATEPLYQALARITAAVVAEDALYLGDA